MSSVCRNARTFARTFVEFCIKKFSNLRGLVYISKNSVYHFKKTLCYISFKLLQKMRRLLYILG